MQIQEAINTAITERVLPSIENSLVAHGRASSTMEDQRASGLQDSPRAPNFTMAVQRSSGLQRNSEVTNPQKTKENRLKMVFSRANQREMSRDSSVDSYTSEQYRDMVTGANLTHTWFLSFSLHGPCNPVNPCNVKIPPTTSLRILFTLSLRLQPTLPLQTPLAVLLKYWSA